MGDTVHVYYTNNNLSTIYFSHMNLLTFKFCDLPMHQTGNNTSFFKIKWDGVRGRKGREERSVFYFFPFFILWYLTCIWIYLLLEKKIFL